jgi:predicted nucleic-acid-binding protein
MRAVDTNVLVRLAVRDDDRQVSLAEGFIASGAWVSQLVLLEFVWVLTSVYGFGRPEVSGALHILLNHAHLTVEESETVVAALGQFRKAPGATFSECLVLEAARKAGHLPLGTFDRDLARLSGAELLGARGGRTPIRPPGVK